MHMEYEISFITLSSKSLMYKIVCTANKPYLTTRIWVVAKCDFINGEVLLILK